MLAAHHGGRAWEPFAGSHINSMHRRTAFLVFAKIPERSETRARKPISATGKMQTTSQLVLGLDEAGRGPALGPMVLAAVVLDEKAAALLATQGVRDSKAFGSSVRARRARAILKNSVEKLARWVGLEVCGVQTIDDYVSQGALNLLERERAVRLIERAPVCSRIIADGRRLFSPLAGRYPHLEARDRAESLHTAVAAASICAKVHRDTLFDEIARRYEADFGLLRGCGYVNSLTHAFVAEFVRRYGHLPPEARASWPWPGKPPPAPRSGRNPTAPVGALHSA
jgi:ribonuclease HII